MRLSEGVPSSPPGLGTSLEESLDYYKAQYELLESELADFQASSKDLEAELEKDIENAEKRERQLKDKAANLQYEVDEWKTKYKQAKNEANSAQNALQKEITALRDQNRTLQLRLRDTEVANDDYERQQRNTESSLEDLEQKYNQTIERGVMLEEEMKAGEQEREALRIEAQRLRDEFADLKIEADITKEKLSKAEALLDRRRRETLTLQSVNPTSSPRSDLSPTTTTASSPSMDTPPAKTTSTSEISDTPTPPSPAASEKSGVAQKPVASSGLPKTRMSINSNTTPRQSFYTGKPNGHTRAPSTAATNRTVTGSSSTFRQSISKSSVPTTRQMGLPQSASMTHLRTLRGKMQKLEERVQTVRSRLPAPTDTPPKASPRSGSALGHHIPASVTVRSSRKRTGGSTVSGVESLTDGPQTPSIRSKTSNISLAPTPTRGEMAAPTIRPSSRASVTSHSSYVPGHSRPGSRMSMSNLRAPLSSSKSLNPAANTTTDRVRPKSSLSNHGYDGAMDEENDENEMPNDYATPTARRSTFGKRTSDVGTAIPSPTKRISIGPATKLPAPTSARRQSSGIGKAVEGVGDRRSPSRQGLSDLKDVKETYDMTETF